MSNILGNYDEIAFGQEALAQLEMALGMASTVHRDYDPTPRARGQYINLRRPSVFDAIDQPGTAQDIKTEQVQIQLSNHKGVLLKITDKELSLSNEKLIQDHIRPMAYAIAKKIDESLVTLGKRIPNYTQQAAAAWDFSDIANVQQVLFDMGCPMEEGNNFLMVNGAMQNQILSKLAGTSSGAKVDDARVKGQIGRLFGIDIFANQNTQTFATTQLADNVGVAGIAAVDATSIGVTGLTASQASSILVGDTFSIAGQAQRYTVMTLTGTDGAGAATLTFEPKLQVATAGTEVLTLHKIAGAARGLNLAYHRNAFALAMAPLDDTGGRVGGAQISTIEDPKTQLTLRSRIFYEGKESAVYVGLDALWGVQVLEENMATRVYSYA